MNIESNRLLDLTGNFRVFYEYWSSLRQDKNQYSPEKSHFNPLDIPALLPSTTMAEYKGEYNLHVRVTGTLVDDILGRNISNTNMFDYYTDDIKPEYDVFFRNILAIPCGGFGGRFLTAPDGAQKYFRSIYLPMCDGDGHNIFIPAYHELSDVPENMRDYNNNIISLAQCNFGYFDIGAGLPDALVD